MTILFLACLAPDAADAPRPGPSSAQDVVLVVVETWRADRLRAFGAERDTMPFVEGLAARGSLYEEAWSPAPWTLPSVGSMMTGLWPHQTGVVRTEHALSPDFTTLAEAMGARGYQTAFFGVNELFTHERGLEQGYDRFEGHTGWSADRLRQELETLERDGRPLFLHLHLFEPHCPYWAPRSHRFTVPVEDPEPVPLELLRVAPDCHVLPDGEVRKEAWFARYDEELMALDGQLERLLRPYGEARIVLVGDHGESLWEEGLIGHGSELVDPALRVPLIVVEPGAAPARIAEPVSGREVYRLVQGEPVLSEVLVETSQSPTRRCRVIAGPAGICAAEPARAPRVDLGPEAIQALQELGYLLPSPDNGDR